MVIIIYMFLFAQAAFAGGSNPPNVGAPSFRKPSSGAKVYFAKNNWTIKSAKDLPAIGKVSGSNPIVWDLEGAILDGSKQRGTGEQVEGQEPLFRASVPLVVKNGFVRRNKNAMTFKASDSGVENMTFTDIGEDAIATSEGAFGLRILNSEFINDQQGDKSIQLNEAKDAVVKGNTVYSGITCMRIGSRSDTNVTDEARVTGNRFIGCRTAINASSITVHESGNKYESVNEQFVKSNGAVIK